MATTPSTRLCRALEQLPHLSPQGLLKLRNARDSRFVSSSVGTDISPRIGLLRNQEIATEIVHKFISVPPYSIMTETDQSRVWAFRSLFPVLLQSPFQKAWA